MTASPPEPAGAARRRPSPARRAVRGLFLVVVLAAVALGIAAERDRVADALAALSAGPLLLSTVLGTAGLLSGLLAWRVLLAGLGSPLGLGTASRIFLVGQLGKYVPGSVWPVLAQMEMGSDAGVPRARMATASVLGIGLSLAASVLVGALAAPALLSGEDGGGSAYALLLLVLPAAALLLVPRVLNPLLERGLRLVRRGPLEQPLTARVLAAGVGLSVLAWLLLGLHAWVLAVDVGAPAGRALAVTVGAYGLASAAGLLVVVAPAGAGVREVVLVAALAGLLAAPAAAVVAVASRLILTLADVALAGAAAYAVRRRLGGRLARGAAGTLPADGGP